MRHNIGYPILEVNRLTESVSRFNTHMNFGERLKLARKHAKLTQKALATASGVSQSVISEAENGDYDGSKYVVQLAGACGVRAEWLSTGRGLMLPQSAIGDTEGAYTTVRHIPLLNTVQAGNPKEVIDDFPEGAGRREIPLDPILAAECGPYTFALEVGGKSMLPDYHEKDIVVCDPNAPYQPGDIVIAKLDADGEATIKKYRDRGSDADGRSMFELIPLNEDFKRIMVNSDNPGRIIGPVVEHRRRLRRGAAR